MWLQRTGSVYSKVNVCLWKWDDPTCQMVEQLQKLCSHISVISFVWQFQGLAQLWPTSAAFCWLCFTVIDDVGSRWVWLLQFDYRSTWYGTDVRCVVTQFIWPTETCNWTQSAKVVGWAQMCLLSGCICMRVSVLATCCLFLITALFVYLWLFLLPLF